MKNKRIMILSIILNVILLIVVCNFATNNVKISNSTYKIKEMNESTQITDLNNQINALNTEHTDYMNYIQSCKIQIASALTNEGVATSDQAKLETMAENIGKIFTERTKLDSDVAATADNITQGKQAYVNGELITGTGMDIDTTVKGTSFSFDKWTGGDNFYNVPTFGCTLTVKSVVASDSDVPSQTYLKKYDGTTVKFKLSANSSYTIDGKIYKSVSIRRLGASGNSITFKWS